MLRELLGYLSRVRNNETEIDHLWSFKIARMQAKIGIWYDTEAWSKAHWAVKLLNYFIIVMLFLLWPSVLIRICMNFAGLPISRMAEGVSVGLGGFLGLISNVTAALKRNTLTQVIQAVDAKVLAVPKDTPRFREWWKEMRKEYVLEGYIILGFCLMGMTIGATQLVYMVLTGRLFYDTVLPLGDKSYTWQWWLQVGYQSWDLIYGCLFYSLKESLQLDLYYHLAALYKVQAETIMELCERKGYDPEEEYQKLKRVFQEMRDLEGITQKFTSFTSPYITAFCTVSYAMVSISGVSILIQSKDSWVNAIAQSITYPIYVAMIIGIWSFVGELLSDNVESMDEALYNCNWTMAPLQMKKLILLYKIRMTKPTFIRGGPFFIMNWELFGEVFKKSYYLMTILADVLL